MAKNLQTVLSRGQGFYTPSEIKFILSFTTVGDEIVYIRKVWNTILIDDCDSMSTRVFNRLHKIANLSWKGKKE